LMSFCAIALGTKFQTIILVSRIEDFQRKADDETVIVKNVGAHCQVRALIRLSQYSVGFSSWDTKSPNAGRRPCGLEIFRLRKKSLTVVGISHFFLNERAPRLLVSVATASLRAQQVLRRQECMGSVFERNLAIAGHGRKKTAHALR